MKFAKLAVAAAALAATPGALANEQVVAGATVYGPQGAVGTIVASSKTARPCSTA